MKYLIFIILLFLIVKNLAAQDSIPPRKETCKMFFAHIRNDSVLSFRSTKGYFPYLIHNLGHQAVSPLHMSKRGWLNTAGIFAITSGLIAVDIRIDHFIKPIKDKNPFIRNVSPQITQLGDFYGYGLVAAFGCYSIVFHDYKAFRTSLLASQAAITAGLWVRAGKILSARMRPGATYSDLQYNSDHWFGPFGQFNPSYVKNRSAPAFDAFPSGHTAAAFAMAAVFAREYKNVRGVPLIMYSLAGIVGISRMIEHEHWASDVFLGAVTGYLCGVQVTRDGINFAAFGRK